MTDHVHGGAVVGARMACSAAALQAACDGLDGEMVYSAGES
jgi:hypothetical protein